MKVVIATGIYPPEIGGPSYYAEGLADAFRKAGHDVRVVPFGSLKKLPPIVRHVSYALRLLPALFGADGVIALDTFSVAVPAAFLCSIIGMPLIIRTGGDFLWEQYVERTGDMLPFPRFYAEHKTLTFKETLIFALTTYALHRAMVVFSTSMQRDVWLAPYKLASTRTHIIGNAVDSPLPSERPRTKNFLWHVRPIAMKNGARLHAAFARAKKTHPDITLEEGVMPKALLMERIKNCYAVVLPSLTEISPNYILDALRFKKPFIMDKYSGLAEWLAPYGTLVDPLSEEDIMHAIGTLAEEAGYGEALKKASAFSFVRTYDDVARDFEKLIVLEKRR